MKVTTRKLTASERQMWTRAGSVWTDDLRLRDPTMLETPEQATAHHAAGSLASINALTYETLLNLHHMRERNLDEFLYTFMAHEIGHHAITPAGMTNQMRYLAAARVMVHSGDVHRYVNLALDLLINDILVTQHKLPCPEIYRRMCEGGPVKSASFAVMLGAMSRLWGCGDLFDVAATAIQGFEVYTEALCALYELHGEARRGSDLVGYVALATRLLHKADESHGSLDTSEQSGMDQILVGTKEDLEALRKWLRSGGLISMDSAAGEARRLIMGAPDLLLDGFNPATHDIYVPGLVNGVLNGTSAGRLIKPTEAIVSYYESMANAHLVTFLSERGGHSSRYPESLKEWAWGDPIEEIDWLQTAIRSGQPIPGVNTVSWEYGSDPEPLGAEPFPVDVDLYIDTSGSMPDPHRSMSHIALGAFIFALSVMRQGGAVRVTIWSLDEHKLRSTQHFSTSREEVLGMLCYSIRGGTQFPVKHWEKALTAHKGRSNYVHTVILSDDGIDTWFKGRYETSQVERILDQVQTTFGAGGTVILNGRAESVKHTLPDDWMVRGCSTWEDVVATCADVASRTFSVNKEA